MRFRRRSGDYRPNSIYGVGDESVKLLHVKKFVVANFDALKLVHRCVALECLELEHGFYPPPSEETQQILETLRSMDFGSAETLQKLNSGESQMTDSNLETLFLDVVGRTWEDE